MLPQSEFALAVETDDHALRAMRPLFAPLTSVEVVCARCDVARVQALGEVLPRMCTRLALSHGSMSREALEQLARSLPWVQRLEVKDEEVVPEDVVAYVHLAARLKREDGVAVRLEEVVVTRPERCEGVSEKNHKREWERAVREVWAAEGGGGVALRVTW